MTHATTALDRLRAGNQRFVAGTPESHSDIVQRRQEVARGQQPFATVLACADSRVAPEILFDQGLGQLFVVRVAGNVVDPVVLGSIEFAATALASRLIVVLGHSRCGAVSATLDALQSPTADVSPNLAEIVAKIRPAFADLSTSGADNRDAVVARAIRASVEMSVAQIAQQSKVLSALVASQDLTVCGAEYALDTGEVTFFER